MCYPHWDVNSEEAMTMSTPLLSLQLTGWGWNGNASPTSYSIPSIDHPAQPYSMHLAISLNTVYLMDAANQNALQSTSRHPVIDHPFNLHECTITGITLYKKIKKPTGSEEKKKIRVWNLVSQTEKSV